MASRRRRRRKKKTGFGLWIGRFALWCFIFLLGVWVALMGLSTVRRNLPEGAESVVAEVNEDEVREYCVDVWNGNGRHGAAGNVAVRLRERGFRVEASDNATRFDYPRTIVVDRVGDPSGAGAVAAAVGGGDVVLQREDLPDACDFLVIVGHDWIAETD
jgi:hypothetical protein